MIRLQIHSDAYKTVGVRSYTLRELEGCVYLDRILPLSCLRAALADATDTVRTLGVLMFSPLNFSDVDPDHIPAWFDP